MCAATCAIGRAEQSAGAAVAAPANAAVADNPIMSPAPSPDYVWMPGRWISEGGQWKWVAAHWELPPSRSAVWVAGHWVPQNGQWAWMNGAWNVTEGAAAQSPGTPPQPPGQGVPVPSTPAPSAEGPYAQTPAGYQVPAVADNGPVNYVYYPDYYYAGDPWAWSLYYPYWGWGLGWGFAGYGYWGHGGYYGHWGHGGGSGHWGHSGSEHWSSGGFGHSGRGH